MIIMFLDIVVGIWVFCKIVEVAYRIKDIVVDMVGTKENDND